MNDLDRYAVSLDNMEVLRAQVEEQAREIERLQLTCNDLDDQNDRIYAELAALKAQSSGVVQWPDADEIMQMAFEEGQPGDDASGYYFELEEFDLFIQRLIDEVARLNSSPVSAGEYGDAYQGAREDLAIWKRRALEVETKIREQDQIIENLGNALNAESGPTFMGEPVIRAGGVVERMAFEAWAASVGYHTERDMFQREKYQSTLTWELWRVWQARAALSALSHGELSVLREYRTAIRNFNDSHGVETDTLDEAVEIERKAEARLEAAEKACHDFYAGCKQEPSHGEQVRQMVPDDLAVNSAAKRLAESFSYPWDFMPEQGREEMRDNVRRIYAELNSSPSAGSQEQGE